MEGAGEGMRSTFSGHVLPIPYIAGKVALHYICEGRLTIDSYYNNNTDEYTAIIGITVYLYTMQQCTGTYCREKVTV